MALRKPGRPAHSRLRPVQSTTQASSIAGLALGGRVNQAAGPAAVLPTVAVLYRVSGLLVRRARRAERDEGRHSLEGHPT